MAGHERKVATHKKKTKALDRKLTMEYRGSLVKHLGLSMYGGAVPSIAELISNSWDADAKRVNIKVPLDRQLSKVDSISVADNGAGMTWDECQNSYLAIGRDRRQEEQRDETALGRSIMGRKGIGKLAGFGIAKTIEVRTVKNHWLTHFSMNFDDIVKTDKYRPPIIADEACGENNGTTITLRNLQITREIKKVDFLKSMSRRFAIFSNQFVVVVDGTRITQEDIDLQMRFPNEGFAEEKIPGFGAVRYWFGFTKKPIHQEDARGVAVLVRNKMAQHPFFFEIRGGVHGQQGLEYMTGEVLADELDEKQDFIGTDRQGIIWSEPYPNLLLNWGQAKTREMLRLWLPRRVAENKVTIYDTIVFTNGVTVEQRLSSLQVREQAEARQVIDRLSTVESITDNPERAASLIDLILRAFEDSSFFDLISALSNAPKNERDEVLRLITEFDVFETVKFAEVVRGRLGVIYQLRQMIDENAPEKPDMQDLLRDHPWLINPQWTLVDHEKQLETILINHFKLDRKAQDGKKRVDFFCVGVRGRNLVVEVKRPDVKIGAKEVQQIIDYVLYLREFAPATGEPPQKPYINGVLVGHSMSAIGARWEAAANSNGIVVQTWDQVFDNASRINREFLEAVKERNPDDARVKSLADGESQSSRPVRRASRAASAKKKPAKKKVKAVRR